MRADQQIADDHAAVAAQRGNRNNGRETAAVLANVGQLVHVLDAAGRLEGQRFETRGNGHVQFDAQIMRAGDDFLRIVNVAGRDFADDLDRPIAQHVLGADVEELNDPLRIGGDDREAGAVENGVLQLSRLEPAVLRVQDRGELGS